MNGFLLIDRFGNTSEGGGSDMGYHLDLVVGDNRYLRRDAPSSIAPNIVISFQDSGANIRFKNGRLQIKDKNPSVTNPWHYFELDSSLGGLTPTVDPNGET